ncbi:hypothetical protein ACFE04_008385 [Oxalis oulophora]
MSKLLLVLAKRDRKSATAAPAIHFAPSPDSSSEGTALLLLRPTSLLGLEKRLSLPSFWCLARRLLVKGSKPRVGFVYWPETTDLIQRNEGFDVSPERRNGNGSPRM